MAIVARQNNYSDLDLDFIVHPVTKDVVKKVGQDAIKRSIRNLILTNFYDRPFRSGIGCNAQKLLFENANPMVAGFLKDAIVEVIKNYEPRVKVVNLVVDFDYDNNGYKVSITYVLLNRLEPANISIFLERLR